MMDPNKTYARFHEPLAAYYKIGTKLIDCNCIIFSTDENSVTLELCEQHAQQISSPSFASPLIKPWHTVGVPQK